MKIFSKLYDVVMGWAIHRHAPAYLSGMSFAESIFWPIPVDVLLAPMALARPHKAWHYAALSTLFSVLGAVIGYWLGAVLYDPVVAPAIEAVGYQDKMQLAMQEFERWGIWVIFIAGFTPIPYKVFTVTAGLMSMAFWPFVLASIVGRGARFFLVAGLMLWGGEAMERKLKQYVDLLGWVVIGLAALLFLIYR